LLWGGNESLLARFDDSDIELAETQSFFSSEELLFAFSFACEQSKHIGSLSEP
jgi:hypothetical protein